MAEKFVDKMTTRKTEFFKYDDLSWDNVADIPRDTPLVLPLGSGYDLEQLAQQLTDPIRIGLLPTFPFGWRGSGRAVPDNIFTQYIANLLDSVLDECFTHACCL